MSQTPVKQIDQAIKIGKKHGLAKLEKYIDRKNIDVNAFGTEERTLADYITESFFLSWSDNKTDGIRMLMRYGLDLDKPHRGSRFRKMRENKTRGLLIERGLGACLVQDGLEKVNPNHRHVDEWGEYNYFTLTLKGRSKNYPLEHLQRMAEQLETINSTDLRYGASEFLWACAYSPSLEIIQTLIDKGADPNFVDQLGENAIHWAFKNTYLSVDDREKLLTMLVDLGCDLDHKKSGGENVMFSAAFSEEKTNLAFKLKVPYTSTNSDGQNIFEYMVDRNKLDEFDRLIALLPDSDTPLVESNKELGGLYGQLARKGSLTVARVQALSQKGFDINEQNGNGATALHHHSVLDRLDVLQAALDEGANPLVANEDGDTPLYLSYARNRSQVTEHFKEMMKALPEDYDPKCIRKIYDHVKKNSRSSEGYLAYLKPYTERPGWTVDDSAPSAIFVQLDRHLNQRVMDHFNFKTRERYTKIETMLEDTQPSPTVLRERLGIGANLYLWRQAAQEVCKRHGESSQIVKEVKAALASVPEEASYVNVPNSNAAMPSSAPERKAVHPIRKLGALDK